MVEAEKKFKRVCKCESCGNEAEMTITCALEKGPAETAKTDPPHAKTKGTGVCSHCGNEADMWIDV